MNSSAIGSSTARNCRMSKSTVASPSSHATKEAEMRWSALSIVGLGVLFLIALAIPAATAIDGPLAGATVSFGQWQTDPPLDRFPNLSPRLRNEHQLIPHEVKIKAGGSVNFIISGFHEPIVYGNGTQPDDVNVNDTITTTGPTPAPPVVLINDPTNRVYRGLDPSLQPLDRSGAAFLQDRVEVVNFAKPGVYLVICGIRGHFVDDGMFGFVKVLP